MLQAHLRLVERSRPQEQDITSVTEWIDGNKPLVANESTFLNDWNDLVAPVRPATRSAVQKLVERFAAWLHAYGYSHVRSFTV